MRVTHAKATKSGKFIDNGVDLSKYSESIEWDILHVAAKINKQQVNNSNDEFYEGSPPQIKSAETILTDFLFLRYKILFVNSSQNLVLHN